MSKQILIVEPNGRDWETLRDVFLRRGDEPARAHNEMEALRLFGAQVFDLVLIEALLPKGSGYELCRKLKYTPRGRTTPILVTGSILRNLRLAQEVRHKYGADDVLVKPLDAAALKKKLDRYLGRPDAAPAEEPAPTPPADFARLTAIRALAGTLPTEGDLRDVPPFYLLPYAASLGDSGVLSVVSGSIEKLVYFQGRRPAYVASNVREESLGQILVERGRITESQYRKSLALMRDTERRQGEVLMEMGSLTHHDLYDAIVEQARRKLLDLAGWVDGRYAFVLEDFQCGDECRIDVDLWAIVHRAVRRFLGPERVLRELAGLLAVPVCRVSDPLAVALDLGPVERRLLSRIDGKRTLEDLAAESDMDAAEFYPLALALLATGNVVPRDEATEARATVTREEIGRRYGAPRPEPEVARALDEAYAGYRSPDAIAEPALPPDADPRALRDRLARFTGPIERAGVDALPPLERLRAKYVLRRAERDFDRLTGGEGEGNGTLKTSVRIADRAARLDSELQYQRGLQALADGAMETAVEALSAAVALAPDVAEYRAQLAWAVYNAGSGDPPRARLAEAERLLAVSGPTAENNLAAALVAGRIQAAEGRPAEALASFDRVLELDPFHVEALRGVRAIEQRLFPPAEASPTDAETTDAEEMIARAAADLYGRTHYQILSLDRAATADEIKRSFFQQTELIRDPALLRRAGPAGREEAEALATRFEEAYETLADPERRRQYDAFLELVEGRRAGMAPGAGTVAERAFQAGRDLVEKAEFRAAQGHFARAVEAYPLDPRYHAYLGMAIFRQSQLKGDQLDAALRRARGAVAQGLLIDGQSEEANVFLGQILAFSGRTQLARRHLNKALDANPDSVDALRELYRLGAERRRKVRAGAVADGPKPAAGDMSEALLSYVYRIDALEDKVRRQNFFEILGVNPFASPDDVEQAYARVRKEVEMADIADLLSEDARKKLHRVQERIDTAYDRLRDENTAAQYRREIRAQTRKRREAVAGAKGEPEGPKTLGARVMNFLNRPIGGKQ